MAINVKPEEDVAEEMAAVAGPPQRSLPQEQERASAGAMAPRPEWLTPPSQQLVPIDRDLIAEIEELAGEEEAARAINDLLRRELRSRRLQALLDEMAEESGGPLTPEELAWAASLPWSK
jgi:Arc/MetJ family transcription regulator